MEKVLLVLILMLTTLSASSLKPKPDYDFFDGLLELFGLGSSEEESYKNVTSKVSELTFHGFKPLNGRFQLSAKIAR